MFDEAGSELLRLADNELTLRQNGVDVQFIGQTMSVFNTEGKLALRITFTPPDGVRLDRLRMRYRDILCEMDDTFGLTMPLNVGGFGKCLVGGLNAMGARAAISYSSDKANWGGEAIRMVGGEGIHVPTPEQSWRQGARRRYRR